MYLFTHKAIKELGSKIKRPGVYKIYCQSQNKKTVLQRLCGEDIDGLLYIGASKRDISYRLSCFINSMDSTRKQNNHAAALRVLNNRKLSEFISTQELYFEFSSQSAENAISCEMNELLKYRLKFGELPPLNG